MSAHLCLCIVNSERSKCLLSSAFEVSILYSNITVDRGQARMRSRKEKVLCDETTVVVTNGHGEPLHCSGEHDNCPGNSECTVNSVEDDKYCCVKPVVDNNWSAVIPLLKCDSNGDCQHGQSCKAAANAPGKSHKKYIFIVRH